MILAVAFGFFASSPSVRAAGTGNFGLGLMLGLAFPNTSSSAFAWGFQAHYKFSPVFAMKAFYQRYGVSIETHTDTINVNDSTSHSFFGVEPDYLFPGAGPGQFHAGLRVGMAKSSIQTSASNGTTTVSIDDPRSNLFLAPVIGYDHPIGIISAGGEISYALGLGESAPKALTLVATGKYWF